VPIYKLEILLILMDFINQKYSNSPQTLTPYLGNVDF